MLGERHCRRLPEASWAYLRELDSREFALHIEQAGRGGYCAKMAAPGAAMHKFAPLCSGVLEPRPPYQAGMPLVLDRKAGTYRAEVMRVPLEGTSKNFEIPARDREVPPFSTAQAVVV